MPENEPLKGKYEEYAVGLWWDKIANQRLTQEANEVLDDVKSAVQGLINEIREEGKKIGKIRKGLNKKDEKERWYCEGYIQALTDTYELIKKWFADVCEETGKDDKTPIIDIDKENHSLLIIFEEGKTKESGELKLKDKTFIFDFDKKGRVVALEILY